MFWKDYSILWSKTNYLYSGQSGGIEKIGESIMLTYFNFILGNGTLITQSFDIRPINYPLASGSFIIPSDPITGSIPPTSLDIPANAYKIQCNLEATNDWYINLTTGSNGTASYSIVSGSLYSGSYCSVIFDILNTWKGTSIDLQPAYKNVGWNNYFVLGDTFPITCSNNTATCNLIQGLTYKGWIRGTIKDTPFSILPSGSSGYASNMLVTSQYVSKIITPQNQGQYGYTAQSSDARFAPIGDSARSASWASSSLFASSSLSSSWASSSLSGSYTFTSSLANSAPLPVIHLYASPKPMYIINMNGTQSINTFNDCGAMIQSAINHPINFANIDLSSGSFPIGSKLVFAPGRYNCNTPVSFSVPNIVLSGSLYPPQGYSTNYAIEGGGKFNTQIIYTGATAISSSNSSTQSAFITVGTPQMRVDNGVAAINFTARDIGFWCWQQMCAVVYCVGFNQVEFDNCAFGDSYSLINPRVNFSATQLGVVPKVLPGLIGLWLDATGDNAAAVYGHCVFSGLANGLYLSCDHSRVINADFGGIGRWNPNFDSGQSDTAGTQWPSSSVFSLGACIIDSTKQEAYIQGCHGVSSQYFLFAALGVYPYYQRSSHIIIGNYNEVGWADVIVDPKLTNQASYVCSDNMFDFDLYLTLTRDGSNNLGWSIEFPHSVLSVVKPNYQKQQLDYVNTSLMVMDQGGAGAMPDPPSSVTITSASFTTNHALATFNNNVILNGGGIISNLISSSYNYNSLGSGSLHRIMGSGIFDDTNWDRFIFNIYSCKVINGVPYYSTKPLSLGYVENGMTSNSYYYQISWSAPPPTNPVDYYKIILYDEYNGYNFNYYLTSSVPHLEYGKVLPYAKYESPIILYPALSASNLYFNPNFDVTTNNTISASWFYGTASYAISASNAGTNTNLPDITDVNSFIGINNTSPSYSLDINDSGSIVGTGTIGFSQNIPDYIIQGYNGDGIHIGHEGTGSSNMGAKFSVLNDWDNDGVGYQQLYLGGNSYNDSGFINHYAPNATNIIDLYSSGYSIIVSGSTIIGSAQGPIIFQSSFLKQPFFDFMGDGELDHTTGPMMRVTTDGGNPAHSRVGIGTITPKNTLDVIGNISCSVITASLLGTASYANTSSNAIITNTLPYSSSTHTFNSSSNLQTGSVYFLISGSSNRLLYIWDGLRYWSSSFV